MKTILTLLTLTLAATLQAGDCCAAKAKTTAVAAETKASCPYMAGQSKGECPAMNDQAVASDEQKKPECKNENCSKEACKDGCPCGEACHGQKSTLAGEGKTQCEKAGCPMTAAAVAGEDKPKCDKEKCCPKDGTKCEKDCCKEKSEKKEKAIAAA